MEQFEKTGHGAARIGFCRRARNVAALWNWLKQAKN
jgi:hypothetical protein